MSRSKHSPRVSHSGAALDDIMIRCHLLITHHSVAQRNCNNRFIIVHDDAFILTLFMLIVLALFILSPQVAAVPYVSHLSNGSLTKRVIIDY